MKKYYFFGAGNNCYGALDFFGRERVIAIIDNSSTKIGTKLLGIPVISFAEFLKCYQGELVIITAFIASEQIELQLKEQGIDNYFTCPYMQSGFYSCRQIINKLNLLEYNNVAIYDKNPIAEVVREEILQSNPKCDVLIISKEDMINETGSDTEVLLIVKDNVKEDKEITFDKYKVVLNIYQEMEGRKITDYCHLEQFRNIYQGQRCFLIGNGPSLQVKDLECLQDNMEMCFGCNQIYKIYEKTNWRPQYCIIGDNRAYIENKEQYPPEDTYFIRNFINEDESNRKVYCYTSIGERYFPGYPTFSADLVQGVYGGRTVMYDMLQIAVYMGFSEIYLLGVDFSWGNDGKDTHFYGQHERVDLIKAAVKYKEEQEHAFVSARNYAESHGIKIYNATRGGNLEIFERKNLDEVFAEIKKYEM